MTPQYISASRRNDLPAFYYKEFFKNWRRGEVIYNGGYGRSYTVSLKREDVLGYIFWSKDFSRFIEHPDFSRLVKENNAVFHYTLNCQPGLEPGIPAFSERLDTLYRLCDIAGPSRVLWRYDPICKYEDKNGRTVITEKPFYDILPLVKKAGVGRCYFSFMTSYRKLKNRGVSFLEFTFEEKMKIASGMQKSAEEAGITLYNCCNPEISESDAGIEKASCIDDDLLRDTDRFGVHRPLKRKSTRKDCNCFESRDIGAYKPACGHACLYCYANPVNRKTG